MYGTTKIQNKLLLLLQQSLREGGRGGKVVHLYNALFPYEYAQMGGGGQ